MSVTQSWVVLIGGATFLLAPSVAVLAGWRPVFLRGARAPVPLLGALGLCVYGGVLATAIPRLVDAPTAVRTTWAYVGLGLMWTAVGLFILYDILAGANRRGGK